MQGHCRRKVKRNILPLETWHLTVQDAVWHGNAIMSTDDWRLTSSAEYSHPMHSQMSHSGPKLKWVTGHLLFSVGMFGTRCPLHYIWWIIMCAVRILRVRLSANNSLITHLLTYFFFIPRLRNDVSSGTLNTTQSLPVSYSRLNLLSSL